MVPRACVGGAADRAYPLWGSEVRATTVTVMEIMMVSNAALFCFFLLFSTFARRALGWSFCCWGWHGVPPASSVRP